MKAMKLLYRISNGMVYAISFVILAILTIKNLIFFTYVMNIKEHISIRNTNVWMTAVFMIGLVLLFYLLFKFSERIDEKKLFLFFSVIYLVAGIYMIININSVLRYDALSVHKASIAIHHGKFTTMDMGHYMYRYPHQIGFLIYEYILGFISYDAKLLFGMNLAAIFGINFFIYKITKEIFNDQHKVNLTAITLSFLFLPDICIWIDSGIFSSDSWSFLSICRSQDKEMERYDPKQYFSYASSTYEEEFYYCTGSVSLLSFFTLFKRT